MSLDKLKALLAEATPGPWLSARVFVETEESRTVLVDWDNEDAALVVEMRNNIEQLMTKLEALEAVAEAARALREAQISYIADRGNDEKGRTVADRAHNIDLALTALDNLKDCK